MSDTVEADDRAASTAAPTKSVAARLLRRVGAQNFALLLALALLCLVIRAQSDKVFLISNLLDVGVAISILGILAVAQMIVIISGGLDISMGSTVGLTGVIVAMSLEHGHGIAASIALGVLTGMAAGALNGFLVTIVSLNPIIVTLATFSAFAGIALRITNGIAIPVNANFFTVIGTEQLLGIPYPVWLLVVFALVSHLYLRLTSVGRHIFAIGSNENAARNTGIALNVYRFGIYLYAGFAAAIGGLLGVAQNGLGQGSGSGADLGLTAITAALLGGAALTGGRGSVIGALLGVLIIGMLNNGLVLVGANPFYSQVFVGALLVAAVALQRLDIGKRLAARRRREDATA